MKKELKGAFEEELSPALRRKILAAAEKRFERGTIPVAEWFRRPWFGVAAVAATVLIALSVAGLWKSRESAREVGPLNGGNSAVNEAAGTATFLDLARLPGNVSLRAQELPAYAFLRDRLGSGAFAGSTYLIFNPGAAAETPAPRLSDMVLMAIDQLKVHLVMNGTRLPDPGDKGVVVLPSPDHEVKRFALQVVKTGDLWVDGRLLEKMDERSVAALLLHEGLIRLWYMDGSNIRKSESGRLRSTDKIADVVNQTFNDRQALSAASLADRMCQAGFRVGPAALLNYRLLELPNPGNPKPAYPATFFIFQNRNCSVREFRSEGPWRSRELKGSLAQLVDNFPEGAAEGTLSDDRIQDRPDASYWRSWVFPELEGVPPEIAQFGPFRASPVRVDGLLETLPVRELHLGKALAPHRPAGRLRYLQAENAESLWLQSDANTNLDEAQAGFSLWAPSGGLRFRFPGDGSMVLKRNPAR
jgi:hypothetical protein